MSPKSVVDDRYKRRIGQNILAVVLCRSISDETLSCHDKSSTTVSGPGPPLDGYLMYEEFVHENMQCFWNPCLVQSMAKLHYKGFLVPDTILLGGSDCTIEVVRSAWRRRVLRAPQGYEIEAVGDVEQVSMTPVPQTQFAPLPEAVCKVTYDLNAEGTLATCDIIAARLETSFPNMAVPGDGILYKCLGELIRERKLYHTGNGYSVVTPDTYTRTSVIQEPDRQVLMTNEEAIARMHSSSRSASAQTDRALSTWSSADRIVTSSPTEQRLKRSYSLRLLRTRDVASSRVSTPKKEKTSVFSRLFRRKNSTKQEQPPIVTQEVTLHSRSTQTKERSRSVGRSSSRSSYREPSPIHNGSRSASLPRRSSTNHRPCPLHGGSVRKPRPSTYNSYREGWTEKLNNGDIARKEEKPLNITNNDFRRLSTPPTLSPGWCSPSSELVDRLLHPPLKNSTVHKPVEEHPQKRREFGETDSKLPSKQTPLVGNSIDVEMTFGSKNKGPTVVSNIETSWNRTLPLRPGTTTISTVTNISTNVSRSNKDFNNPDVLPKTKMAEAKAAFFSDKHTDPPEARDDSGFSTTSSHPISVAL